MIDIFVSIVNYSVSRIVALVSIVILKWQYSSALVFNKMALTLRVIDVDTSGLNF